MFFVCFDSWCAFSQVYHSKLRKVPIPDMTAVLSVRSATRSKPVRQNQFVRLKRKPYKDDLAKVVEVRRNTNEDMMDGLGGRGGWSFFSGLDPDSDTDSHVAFWFWFWFPIDFWDRF